MSLPAQVESILGTLRDVHGVAGSFVALGDGRLLSRDMASMFSDELLMEVAPRITRIADAFAMDDGEVISGCIAFQHYTLFMHRLPYGHLCVLGANDTYLPALRMGMKLAGRRIDAAVQSTGSPAPPQDHHPSAPPVTMPPPRAAFPPTPTPSPRALPSVPGAPAQSARGRRQEVRYRGHVLPGGDDE